MRPPTTVQSCVHAFGDAETGAPRRTTSCKAMVAYAARCLWKHAAGRCFAFATCNPATRRCTRCSSRRYHRRLPTLRLGCKWRASKRGEPVENKRLLGLPAEQRSQDSARKTKRTSLPVKFFGLMTSPHFIFQIEILRTSASGLSIADCKNRIDFSEFFQAIFSGYF